jgi:hypothetical protein
MKQRVLTFFQDFQSSGASSLDAFLQQFEKDGWLVKQISTAAIESANHVMGGIPMPRVAITVLIEKL